MVWGVEEGINSRNISGIELVSLVMWKWKERSCNEAEALRCLNKCGTIHWGRGYSRGPQAPDHGLVMVHGRLGTKPHSRRWAAGEGAKLHVPLPVAPHRSHYHLNHPSYPSPRVRWKIVFHETGPWCQKGWGPLGYRKERKWLELG